VFQNVALHIEQQYFEYDNTVFDCSFVYSVVNYNENKSFPMQYDKLIPSIPAICFTFIREDKIHLCKLRNYSPSKSDVNIVEELLEDSKLQMLEIASYSTVEISTLMSRQSNTEYISFIDINSDILMAVGENLKQIKSLKYFSIRLINITSNKVAAELISSVITNNTFLEDITISHCNSNDVIFTKLTKALQSAHSLKNLNLRGSFVSDAVKQLATALLSDKETLEKLQLSQCEVDTTHMNMHHNALIDSFMETQDLKIISSSGLSYVELSNCDFQESELINIFKALIKKSSLKTIDISSNNITDIAAFQLADIISKNVNIECLNLLNCDISYHGIKAILASLRNIKSLRCIMLNCKAGKLPTTTNEDIEMLSSALSDHKSIEKIILNNCKSDKIFNALSKLSSLQLLDLSSSTVSSNVLASIVANNVNLHYLNISYCKIPHKYLVEVIESALLLCS